jgi:N-acetylglucosamine-6-phosphate deacetylase
MGPKPAEHARRHRLAITADRIFDGYRWHNSAVILIDGGVVQCIAPRDQSAGDWPTEVMPSGTMLAHGFIDLQVNGGGGILLNDEPTPGAMRSIARAHRRYGTTSCLPTLISDTRAMPTVGTEQDHFELMGRQIQLWYGRLVFENGTLAGAHLDLASAVKNAVTLVGISLDDALRAASLVPARFLGIEHHRGTPSAGARADIVALTANLELLTTRIAGERPE